MCGIFSKLMGLRRVLRILEAISGSGDLIYRFDLLQVEFAPLSKQIGAAHLRRDRRSVNVLYSELVKLNVKFKTNKYHRSFNEEKEITDYSTQKLLYEVETEIPPL